MTDEHDIGEALSLLASTGDPVSIYPASSTNVVMARIASVDPRASPLRTGNSTKGEYLPPGEILCVAWLRSAKLQFKLNQPEWLPLADQPTMMPADFPEKCQVLNRRSATRLETPLGIYYLASFVLHGKPYELQIYDFSAGGVGLRASPRDAVGLHIGRKLQRVRLELGPDSVLIADLEIRLSRTFRSFLLGEQVQIGLPVCQPVAPSMQAELNSILEKLNSNKKAR